VFFRRELLDDSFDLLTDLHDFFGLGGGLFGHFNGGKQSINTGIDLNESTEALDLADSTVDDLSFVELVFKPFPAPRQYRACYTGRDTLSRWCG